VRAAVRRPCAGCIAPARGAPEGAALWTPAGAQAPDPEMLAHLCFACGRDGGSGCGVNLFSCADRPAKRLAGRSGGCIGISLIWFVF